jgi:Holliday junction resolvase YEN1
MFHKPNHAQMGRNPEVRALFFKLASLIDTGVNAVFVFDGPNKPKVKRNKRVIAKPHWLVAEFREMITLFGFHSYIVTPPALRRDVY